MDKISFTLKKINRKNKEKQVKKSPLKKCTQRNIKFDLPNL